MKYQYKQLKGAMMENVYLGFCKIKDKLKLQQNITHSTSVMKKENKSCANNKRERHTIKKNL